MITLFYSSQLVRRVRTGIVAGFALITLIAILFGGAHYASAASFYEPAITVPAQYDPDTGQLVKPSYTYIRSGFTVNFEKTKFYPNESMTVTAGGDTIIKEQNPNVSVGVRFSAGAPYTDVLPRSFITGYAAKNFIAPAVPGNYTMNTQGTTHSVIYGTGSQNLSFTIYPFPPAIPIITLSANQTSVANGQPVILTWNSSDATFCQATGDWSGSFGPSGTVTTAPLTKTGVNTFTMRCGNSSWHTSKGVGVSVSAPIIPPPETVPPQGSNPPVETSSSVSVDYGGSVDLSWSVSDPGNTISCSSTDDWVPNAAKPDAGSANTGALTSAKIFGLDCVDSATGASAKHRTYVSVRSAPVISVTPASWDFGSIPSGSSSFRTFTVENTGGSTLLGSITVLPPFACVSDCSYSVPAGLSVPRTLRFDATAPGAYNRTASFSGGGGATRPVSGVSLSVAPIVSLSAGATTVPYDTATTLTWAVSGASSCTASGDWAGSKNSSGGSEPTQKIKTTKTYTLSCTGPGGTAADTETVSVNAPVCGNSVCERPGETPKSCSKDCPLIIEEF